MYLLDTEDIEAGAALADLPYAEEVLTPSQTRLLRGPLCEVMDAASGDERQALLFEAR